MEISSALINWPSTVGEWLDVRVPYSPSVESCTHYSNREARYQWMSGIVFQDTQVRWWQMWVATKDNHNCAKGPKLERLNTQASRLKHTLTISQATDKWQSNIEWVTSIYPITLTMFSETCYFQKLCFPGYYRNKVSVFEHASPSNLRVLLTCNALHNIRIPRSPTKLPLRDSARHMLELEWNQIFLPDVKFCQTLVCCQNAKETCHCSLQLWVSYW